jgi:hypothetical protein
MANAATELPQCAPPLTAARDVAGTIKQLFAAASADDLQSLLNVTTPAFYAFDGGARLTARSLMEAIQKAHAAGKHYEWNVTDPDVHVTCNTAWVAYVNRGSVSDAVSRQDVTWLESADLEYSNGRWRIRFFHSTRLPVPK